jgi:hypothetical protein
MVAVANEVGETVGGAAGEAVVEAAGDAVREAIDSYRAWKYHSSS